MKAKFIKTISILLSCIVFFSAFSGTFAFAYESEQKEAEVMEIEPKNGWNDEGTIYYVNDVAVTGFYTIENSKYYFDPSNGAVKVTGLQTIEGKIYLFAESGEMLFGWQNCNNDKYYFDKTSGAAKTGLVVIDKNTYFFDAKSAKMKTGWKTIGKDHYYFENASGKAVKGLKKIGAYYYYFASNAKRIKGWKNISNYRYFFGITTGRAVTGFKKIYSSYYYFNKNARMQTGWKTLNGHKYYFNPKKGSNYGKAATKATVINGKTYYFDKYGRFVSAQTIMKIKAKSIASKTNYLVLVNKNTHRVGIFTGKKGNWKMVKYYACTIGAPATPTPTGTFTLGPSRGMPYHQIYFDSGAVRCWYATRILGGYNFHSVLYSQASKPVKVVDPTLGANLSHGCVRLHINNAKWMYYNVPSGTKCVIYNR